MLTNEFIDYELSGYNEIIKLECLITRATDNNNYVLDFIENFYYGAQKMESWTNIYYNESKIDGYLAHELFHANLYRQGFPNPKEFFDRNNNINILHSIIDSKSNDEIFNCLAHLKFFQDYLDCGFNENEFVMYYDRDLINSACFCKFVDSYDVNNIMDNKNFIEKYITIKTDLNANRYDININRLSKMQEVHFDLSVILDNLINNVKEESDILIIENIVQNFYLEINKICR